MFVFAGEGLVPEQADETQEDAARGGGQGTASSCRQQQKQPSREQMETGDSGTNSRGKQQTTDLGDFAV